MAAYDRVNGAYCAENRWLLHDVVKREWGFRGIVVSDWLAVNDRPAGIEAGLHLQMPGGLTAASVVAAVAEGRLAEARLDELVRELLAFVLQADAARRPDAAFDADDHHRLARRVAAECAVLLKNDGGLLPLASDRLGEVAVIGAFARAPRFQGAGSSEVVPTRVENAHDELVALLGADRVSYAAGYGDGEEPDPALLEEARAVAARAGAAVVCVGLPPAFESEALDRAHIALPAAHDALVEAVLAVQPNTVVVLTNGSAVAMPWAGAGDRRGVAGGAGRRGDRRRPARAGQPVRQAGGVLPGPARGHPRLPELPG